MSIIKEDIKLKYSLKLRGTLELEYKYEHSRHEKNLTVEEYGALFNFFKKN